MSLQSEEQKVCPCRLCPWKIRKDCVHYGAVCLELRNCAVCELAAKGPLEKCLQEERS